jgi:cell volume regulation protein A
LEFDRTENTRSETREFDILPGTVAVGKAIAELGLPTDVLVLLIRRGKDFVVPRGQTRIEPYDTLLVLAEPASLQATRSVLLARAPAESPADTMSGFS